MARVYFLTIYFYIVKTLVSNIRVVTLCLMVSLLVDFYIKSVHNLDVFKCLVTKMNEHSNVATFVYALVKSLSSLSILTYSLSFKLLPILTLS